MDTAPLTLIVRGLLADPSGSEDDRFRRVILRRVAEVPDGPDRVELEDVDPAGALESLRAQVRERIEAFASRQGRKPAAVAWPAAGLHWVVEHGQTGRALDDRVALVTGAAGAIGTGICQALVENGAFVAATDLPGEKLDRLVAELHRIGPGRALGVGLDVTSPESTARGFEAVIGQWGGVDIVVVVAGIAMVAALVDLDLAAFQRLERVNVEGALLTLAEAGRRMILQGTGGDVIVISTKNVPAPGARFGAYSATKAACHQLARIASLELAEFDIRVNMVAPDAVFGEGEHRSGLWAAIGPDRMRARGLDEAGLEQYYRSRNLLKARVLPRHVANAVLFFATRQTPTTGATIPVDGGLPDATPR